MKRPTIKKEALPEEIRNNPVWFKLTALLFILTFPVSGTIILWKEYGHEILGALGEVWVVLVGKWED